MRTLADGVFLAVIDALGHGSRAHMVAERAVTCLEAYQGGPVAELMQQLNTALAGTLGAAAGLAFLEHKSRQLTWTGVGNTRLHKVGGQSFWGVSVDGIVGQ